MKYRSDLNNNQQKKKRKLIISYLIGNILVGLIILVIMLVNNFQFRESISQIMIGGIPLPLYLDIITDPQASLYFVTGNKFGFRNRLRELNIQAKMMYLYRPYFSSDIELENYIDQMFYKLTGYANRSEYFVGDDGDLIRKIEPPKTEIKPNKPQGLFDVAKPSYPAN